MKTGISRKIDDLGRIVIPKEIRNNLNIKLNDELEIFVSNNEIILKKYTKLDNIKNLIEILIKNNKNITDKEVFITDKTKIFNNNENITDELVTIINNNKDLNNKTIKLTDQIEINGDIYIIRDEFMPIGSIVIEESDQINKKIGQMILEIINNYLAL